MGGKHNRVRVVLADDSLLALTMIQRILTANDTVEVVGTATDGVAALELVEKERPDVICTDLHMPRMDGLELTRRVMRHYPTPILVVSVSVHDRTSINVFNLFEAGAVEVCGKPERGFAVDSAAAQELYRKVMILSRVRVFRHSGQGASRKMAEAVSTVKDDLPGDEETEVTAEHRKTGAKAEQHATARLVAIGGSTGAPNVFKRIFSMLPQSFPLPLLCVQHISRGFTRSMVEWLDDDTPLRVKVASQGELVESGVAYFPPDRTHLMVENGRIRLMGEERDDESGHRPSVDRLLSSVAEEYGRHAIAILLTGMGRDGADGIARVHAAGGYTITQDERSSVIYGMPREAAKLTAVDQVLSDREIAPALIQYLHEIRTRMLIT